MEETSDRDQARAALVALSRALGEPARDFAVLGEGNTSVALADGTFYVKASGSSLSTLTAGDLCRVRCAPCLAAVDAADERSEEEVAALLQTSLVDASQPRPSVETFLHAACLRAGATWVGHTHMTSALALLCGPGGATVYRRHLFPDAIVVCGLHVAAVPYVDPGLALARAVDAELTRFAAAHGRPPKLLLLENHGVVALGRTAREVLDIHVMTDKWSRALAGAIAAGGPRYLPDEEAARIDARLDEAYRRRRLAAATALSTTRPAAADG